MSAEYSAIVRSLRTLMPENRRGPQPYCSRRSGPGFELLAPSAPGSVTPFIWRPPSLLSYPSFPFTLAGRPLVHRCSSPPDYRPAGCGIVASQSNLLGFLLDYQIFSLVLCVFHGRDAVFPFHHPAAVRHRNLTQGLVLRH